MGRRKKENEFDFDLSKIGKKKLDRKDWILIIGEIITGILLCSGIFGSLLYQVQNNRMITEIDKIIQEETNCAQIKLQISKACSEGNSFGCQVEQAYTWKNNTNLKWNITEEVI